MVVGGGGWWYLLFDENGNIQRFDVWFLTLRDKSL